MKALYRRSQARYFLGKIDAGWEDLEKVREQLGDSQVAEWLEKYEEARARGKTDGETAEDGDEEGFTRLDIEEDDVPAESGK